MSNQTISVQRELVERITNPFGDPHDKFNAVQELRALLAKPAETDGVNWKAVANEQMEIIQKLKAAQHQGEPVSSTSDKYKAELYDEVWQLAQGMGFGNVTDALMKLQSQLQGEPPSYKPGLYAVRHIDNWDGERDVALTFANLDADGKWTDSGTGDALLAYRGDKILRAWPLDCSDAPGAQIIGVPRNWLEDWALELVEAAQDGGQMSNQVEHLLQLYPKQ